MASDPTNLFDAQFNVQQIDPDGKKFDRVSRIVAHAPASEIKLSIDIAVDIYPMAGKRQFTLQLARTLHRDSAGAEEKRGKEEWRIDVPGNEGITADFDYVMHGKVRFLCVSFPHLSFDSACLHFIRARDLEMVLHPQSGVWRLASGVLSPCPRSSICSSSCAAEHSAVAVYDLAARTVQRHIA